jgi:hypothetical protein
MKGHSENEEALCFTPTPPIDSTVPFEWNDVPLIAHLRSSQLIFLSSQWPIKGKLLACASCGLGVDAPELCPGGGKELRFGRRQLH